jgi:hypothetical protein
MVGFDIPSLDDDLDYEPPPADPDPTPTARPLPSPTDIREHPMWQTNFAGDIPSPKPVRKPQAAPSNADDLDELD